MEFERLESLLKCVHERDVANHSARAVVRIVMNEMNNPQFDLDRLLSELTPSPSTADNYIVSSVIGVIEEIRAGMLTKDMEEK